MKHAASTTGQGTTSAARRRAVYRPARAAALELRTATALLRALADADAAATSPQPARTHAHLSDASRRKALTALRRAGQALGQLRSAARVLRGVTPARLARAAAQGSDTGAQSQLAQAVVLALHRAIAEGGAGAVPMDAPGAAQPVIDDKPVEHDFWGQLLVTLVIVGAVEGPVLVAEGEAAIIEFIVAEGLAEVVIEVLEQMVDDTGVPPMEPVGEPDGEGVSDTNEDDEGWSDDGLETDGEQQGGGEEEGGGQDDSGGDDGPVDP